MPRRRSGIALGPWLDIVLVGVTNGWLGQSLWLREIARPGGGRAAAGRSRRPNGHRRLRARARSWPARVRACHDVSDGGLLVAVAEMAMAGLTGVRLSTGPREIPSHAYWFGEDQGRYVLAVPDSARADPRRRSGRAAGGADRHVRRTGFDTARWGHNIGAGVARGARTLLPVLDGRQRRTATTGRAGMAMAADEIEALIKAAIPDARVTIEDLAGDGDHYAATVVSETFRGIPRVKQHQIVYAALRGRMGGELHALALQTSAPERNRRIPKMANDVFERIQSEISDAPVMLYMKGTAMFPQCGFSARVVQILTHMGVPFKTANVLEDMELREGIKQFSQWPTVPQLYVKGEFVGGCDIVTEMFQSGELETLLAEKGVEHKTEAEPVIGMAGALPAIPIAVRARAVGEPRPARR